MHFAKKYNHTNPEVDSSANQEIPHLEKILDTIFVWKQESGFSRLTGKLTVNLLTILAAMVIFLNMATIQAVAQCATESDYQLDSNHSLNFTVQNLGNYENIEGTVCNLPSATRLIKVRAKEYLMEGDSTQSTLHNEAEISVTNQTGYLVHSVKTMEYGAWYYSEADNRFVFQPNSLKINSIEKNEHLISTLEIGKVEGSTEQFDLLREITVTIEGSDPIISIETELEIIEDSSKAHFEVRSNQSSKTDRIIDLTLNYEGNRFQNHSFQELLFPAGETCRLISVNIPQEHEIQFGLPSNSETGEAEIESSQIETVLDENLYKEIGNIRMIVEAGDRYLLAGVPEEANVGYTLGATTANSHILSQEFTVGFESGECESGNGIIVGALAGAVALGAATAVVVATSSDSKDPNPIEEVEVGIVTIKGLADLVNENGPYPEGDQFFIVESTVAPTKDLTINLRVISPGDYLTGALPSFVKLGAGSKITYLNFQIDDDEADEADSYIESTIIEGADYRITEVQHLKSARVALIDDDPEVTLPRVSVRANIDSLTEGGGNPRGGRHVFVEISEAQSTDLTVKIRVDDPGSYIEGEKQNSVLILAGASQAHLEFQIIDDGIDEADNVVTVSVIEGEGYLVTNVVENSTAEIEVLDDEVPRLSIAAANPQIEEIVEGESVTVSLTADIPPWKDLTVNLGLYTKVPNTPDTFTAVLSAGTTSKEVTVMSKNNDTDEDDYSIWVGVSEGQDYDLNDMNDQEVQYSVSDDDVPELSIRVKSNQDSVVAGTPIVFEISAKNDHLVILHVIIEFDYQGRFFLDKPNRQEVVSVLFLSGKINVVAEYTLVTRSNAFETEDGSVTARLVTNVLSPEYTVSQESGTVMVEVLRSQESGTSGTQSIESDRTIQLEKNDLMNLGANVSTTSHLSEPTTASKGIALTGEGDLSIAPILTTKNATAEFSVDDELPEVSVSPVHPTLNEGGIAKFALFRNVHKGRNLVVDLQISQYSIYSAAPVPTKATFLPYENKTELELPLKPPDGILNEDGAIVLTILESENYKIRESGKSAKIVVKDHERQPVSNTVNELNLSVLPEFTAALTSEAINQVSGRIKDDISKESKNSFTSRSDSMLKQIVIAGGDTINSDDFSISGIFENTPEFNFRVQGSEIIPTSLWSTGATENVEFSSDSTGNSKTMKMASNHFGIDSQISSNFSTGAVFSYLRTEFKPEVVDFQSSSPEIYASGQIKNTMTVIHPYLSWSSQNGDEKYWTSAGYGTGEVQYSFEGHESLTHKASTEYFLASAGGYSQLVSSKEILEGGLTNFGYESEIGMSRLVIESNEENIHGSRSDFNYFQFAFLGSHNRDIFDTYQLNATFNPRAALMQKNSEKDIGLNINADFTISKQTGLSGGVFGNTMIENVTISKVWDLAGGVAFKGADLVWGIQLAYSPILDSTSGQFSQDSFGRFFDEIGLSSDLNSDCQKFCTEISIGKEVLDGNGNLKAFGGFNTGGNGQFKFSSGVRYGGFSSTMFEIEGSQNQISGSSWEREIRINTALKW